MRGRYELTQWIWNGDGLLDLDGDGIASANLFKEAHSLNNGELYLSYDCTAIMSGWYDYDNYGSITVHLPIQQNGRIEAFMRHEIELCIDRGNASFYMDKNGKISLVKIEITHLHGRESCVTNYSNMSINWSDDKLTISADATFYDFVTESKVKGPVVLTYSKYATSPY